MPRSSSGRARDELRARMVDGTYPLRSFLPSQRDLAQELRVSRNTVQRALREMAREGWIESRQGSGSPGTVFVDGAQAWFDSVWQRLAEESASLR